MDVEAPSTNPLARSAHGDPSPSATTGHVDGGPLLQLHCGRRKLLDRLDGERRLFCSVLGCQIVVGLTLCVYGAGLVFRNIAFFRHRGLVFYANEVMPDVSSGPVSGATLVNSETGESMPLMALLAQLANTSVAATPALWNVSIAADNRANLTKLGGEPFALLDAPHELLPDLSQAEWATQTVELVANAFVWVTILMLLVPCFVSVRGKPRPYFFGIGLRFCHALTSGHTLRAITYLATSIPGPAKHCQSVHWYGKDGVVHGWEEINRQHVMTVSSWFFDTWNHFNNSNCGDLVFSGHTFQAVTNAMMITHYARQIFPDGAGTAVIVFAWVVLVIEVFFILTSFDHYGVDAVIALYFAPLNWLFWHWLRPRDPTPETVEDGYILQCWRLRPKVESAQS